MPNSQTKTFFFFLVIVISQAVKMPNFKTKTFFFLFFGHRLSTGCEMPNFQAQASVLVHWNGGGPLEPWWAWHGPRDKKVADPCSYFEVYLNVSPA